MRKQEFLTALKEKLSGLPKQEVEERLAFYGEMIDDRIEEGLTEEEAVSDVGSVDKVASQIISEIPFLKIVKARMKPKKRFATWEIVLLALGSPIWIALAAVAFAVLLSLYVVVWALAICVWAVTVSLVACGIAGAFAGVLFVCTGHGVSGAFIFGAGLVSIGLGIFLFFACKPATKGIVWLTKMLTVGIKKCLIKKESRQ